MSNPMQAWNAWCALSLQAARLGWEAQGVIALRMMRLATQSAGGQTEARRMVTEKVAALAEAQAAAAAAVIKGAKDHHVAKKVLAGITKALASLDRGKGIAHARISEWVASWETRKERPAPKRV